MTRLVALISAALALVLIAAVWASPDRSAESTVLIVVDASPATATNVVNTDHTVTATVTNFGTPVEGSTVFFNVTSGPNAGVNGSDATDVNGEANFTYNGGGVGQDTIDACVFSPPGPGGGTPFPLACDTVTKDWIDPTPSPSPEPSPSPTLAAGTATPSPSPSAAAPVSLPGTGGEPGGTNFTSISALMFVVIGAGWIAGVALLRRI